MDIMKIAGRCRSLGMLVFLAAAVVIPQTVFAHVKAPAKAQTAAERAMYASPAYAEVLLRRTELESELEALTLEYTEEFPKVKEIRQALIFLKRESDRLAAVKPAESSKLTLALGKMIVRKVELETDVWNLLKGYKEDHPDVRRAQKKVEIYEAAIKEILG